MKNDRIVSKFVNVCVLTCVKREASGLARLMDRELARGIAGVAILAILAILAVLAVVGGL